VLGTAPRQIRGLSTWIPGARNCRAEGRAVPGEPRHPFAKPAASLFIASAGALCSHLKRGFRNTG
jgi:hypothetical protein